MLGTSPSLRAVALTISSVLAAGFVVGVIASPLQVPDTWADLVREPAIDYFTAPVNDQVAELNRKLQSGAVRLTFDDARGYLPSVLQALGVLTASQVVVFSKTSVQASRITPQNPRAIYFDDSVSVGYIHDG